MKKMDKNKFLQNRTSADRRVGVVNTRHSSPCLPCSFHQRDPPKMEGEIKWEGESERVNMYNVA